MLHNDQDKYDIIIIGAGAAGLSSAYTASAMGHKALLIEEGNMGGDCLNVGCVPSKSLLHVAGIVKSMKKGDKIGIKDIQYKVDFKEVMNHVENSVNTIAPEDSVERYEGLGVKVIKGHAEFKDSNTVSVNNQDFYAKRIVIATGGKPFIPPIEGLKDTPFMTTENFWEMRKQPKKLVILGGGVVATELGYALSILGTEVELIFPEPNYLGILDSEVAANVKEIVEDVNIKLNPEVNCSKVSYENDIFTLETNKGLFSGDALLIVAGRKPIIEGFGLEKTGVETSRFGITVNESMQTSVPNIYAVGDVAGRGQFTHIAGKQAVIATIASTIGNFLAPKMNFNITPWTMYLSPQIAFTGYSSKYIKDNNIDISWYKYDLKHFDRAIVEANTQGFVKIGINKNTGKIAQVWLISQHAGEIINEFTSAIAWNKKPAALLSIIRPYPSWSLLIQKVLGLYSKELVKPSYIKWMKRIFGYGK